MAIRPLSGKEHPRHSHKVRALLGSPSRKQDPYATIELNRFAEEPFIALMCSSTTSQLLNLLRWYVQKGRGRADALAFQGQLLNLLAHIRTFGDYMTARVAEGSFSPRRLAAAIEQADGNVRHEQITLNKATERQPLITNGVPPLKIVLGEMLWKPGTEVRAEDVGLEKLHRISLSRQA